MHSFKDTYHILLVEDDLGDVGLVRISLKRAQRSIHLHHVVDGLEALGFLRNVGGGNQDAPRPDLILLDLNLPGRSGHEILEEIKTDRSLRTIPVIILTTSDAERDVVKSYRLGANAVITKPMDMEAFAHTVLSIQDYWFGISQLVPAP